MFLQSRDDTLTDAKSKLETINSEIVTLEERIAALNRVQVSFGLETKTKELSRSVSSTKKVVFLDETSTKTADVEADDEWSAELSASNDTDQEFEEQHSTDNVIDEQAELEIPDTQDEETESHDATMQGTVPEIMGEEYLEADEEKPTATNKGKKEQMKKTTSQAKQTKQSSTTQVCTCNRQYKQCWYCIDCCMCACTRIYTEE